MQEVNKISFFLFCQTVIPGAFLTIGS